MTPREKAKELVSKYYKDSDLLVEDLSWTQAKECALMAVNEILNLSHKLKQNDNSNSNIDNCLSSRNSVKSKIRIYKRE